MKRVGFLLAMGCLLFLGRTEISCQQTAVYVNPEKYYSIDLPSNWIKDYAKKANISVLFAYDSLQTDKKIAVTTAGSPTLSLKEVYKITMRNIKSDKSKVIEAEGETTVNGNPALWCLYSFSIEEGIKKVKMVIIKKGSMQYTVQAILNEDVYEESKEDYDKIIATFKIL